MEWLIGMPAVQAARVIHDALMHSLSWAAWAAAAALLVPFVRRRAGALLDSVDAADPARVRRGVLLAGAAAAAWFALLKFSQYRAFQLTLDSAIVANTAADFVAGRGLECVVDGTPSVFSVHFAFFVPVFLGPVLLWWRSPLPLLLFQGAAVASVGLAAYLLAERRTRSRAWGLAAMGLTLCHPSFHHLATADLENSVFGLPLLLWGLVCWDSGRFSGSVVLWALALTTREQFPFCLAGLGIFHALSGNPPARRRRLQGALVVAGAAALWWLELRWLGYYAGSISAGYWQHYARFGATRGEIIRTVLTRPDLVFLAVVWPPSHLMPLVELLGGMAFLPLAAPAALAFLLTAMFHNLLQTSMYIYLQNSAYSFGPSVFAAACGLGALADRTESFRRWRVWLLAVVLAAAGWGLRHSPRVVNSVDNLGMARQVPPLLRLIPPLASVWTDDFAAPPLSTRPQLKTFAYGASRARFDVLLFRPEFVLLDKGTLVALAAAQSRVVAFLAREGYAKLAESGDFVLLKDPRAPRGGRSPALALPGEAGDGERAAAFMSALFDSAEARQRLAGYPADLRFAPSSADGHLILAQALLGRKLAALALDHARQAVTLRPDKAEAHSLLADSLAAQGDMAGASGEYRAALGLDPHLFAGLMNFGNVLLKTGKSREALSCYEQALAMAPDAAPLHANRGVALLSLGRRPEARAAFETALRLDPGNALARRFLPSSMSP